MTLSAQGQDLALGGSKCPLSTLPHAACGPLPFSSFCFQGLGDRAGEPRESHLPLLSSDPGCPLPWPNPEPSPCSPFTHPSSPARLTLSRQKSQPHFHSGWGFSPQFFQPPLKLAPPQDERVN